tara:strand:- start:573 stop:1850 length:1278 start_codon:yes stop_codon:yes gene_type:complete
MSALSKKDSHQVAIKKHINAIHCTNNISLVQRKVFNALLYHAYHDLPTKSQFEIPVRLLSELIGYDSNDRKKLKKSLMGLITTAIEWNVLDSKNADYSKWTASSIISSAKIENGICTYEFSSMMRELLYHPDVYGRIDMLVMSRFKSGYGLALYENCVRFQGLSNTGWVSIDVFRKLMGIADGTYSVYCDFKKRVLDKALKEVNQLSNLHVVPEVKRVNKKVTSIRFKLAQKQAEMIHVEHLTNTSDLELSKILTDEFGLSIDLTKDVLSRYEEEYIRGKIALIKDSSNFKSGNIRDLAAYLADALKRDYKKSKSSRALISQAKQAQLDIEKQNQKMQEKQKNEYGKYVSVVIEDHVSSLSTQDKEHLFSEFEQVCDQYSLKKFKKHGLSNASVKSMFNMFIKNSGLGKGLKILGFEEFVRGNNS